MKRFPDHSRVVFIGDSITAAGWWVAHVYDHYLRNFPDADIHMYNAGIAGAMVKTALHYFEENIMIYQPTHAVIMMGMNDVGRGSYELDAQGELLHRVPGMWMGSLNRYEAGMRTLIEKLQARGISLTLVTPTCYDESADQRNLNLVGCDAGLEYMGELLRRMAEEYGCDYVNIHSPFRLLNVMQTMISPDRIHPLESGHIVMAQLFLHAQGLADEPILTTFQNLPQSVSLLPENLERFRVEQILRGIWRADWHLLRDYPADEQLRRAYLQSYEAPSDLLESMRTFYLEYGSHRKELLEKELALCDACANRAK